MSDPGQDNIEDVIKEEKENPETFSDKLLDKIRGN